MNGSLVLILIGCVVLVLITLGRLALQRRAGRSEGAVAVPRLAVLVAGLAFAAIGFTVAVLIARH